MSFSGVLTRKSYVALIVSICILSISGIARAETITIGTISAYPVEEARTFRPFTDFLAAQLAGDGIEGVEIKVAGDIAEAAEMLKAKQIDFFIDSSVTASVVNNLSGSKFLLRRWKKARAKYRSVIFVNADRGINSLDDLIGKVVAFEEPFSTSGYILPALAMLRSGLKLSPIESNRSQPPTGTIGYVMANDNETQMAWLERDLVAAVAMAEGDFKDFSKSALKPLRLIHTTPYVPYHVITHRADLESQYVQSVKRVLLSADQTSTGKQALQKFERTTKFDEIPDALLSEVLELTPYLSDLNPSQ